MESIFILFQLPIGPLQAQVKSQCFQQVTFVSMKSILDNCYHNPQGMAGCWWLTPVILALQEAEIKRIAVRRQPGQIVLETLSCKNPSQKGR
jgi:hypothetical protein